MQQQPEKLDFPAYGLLLLEAAARMAPIDSGTVTSPAGIGSNVLNAGDKSWPVGKLAYLWVVITEGAGRGQARVILRNTANTLVIEGTWDVALNTTSRFKIVSPFDLRQALRDVLGGGDDISAANPLPVDISPGPKTVTEILNEATIGAGATTVLADCVAIDLSQGASTLAITVRAVYGAAALGIRLHILTSPTNDATDTHTGGAHATILTDANAHWVAGRLVGLTVNNVTDGSAGVITANTANTATVAALAGGTANAWALNDVYSIPGGDYDTEDWDTWNPAFAANTVIMQTEVWEVDPAYVKVLVENLDAGVAVTIVEIVATVGP